MADLTEPLTDEELDRLNAFLLDRIPAEAANAADADEGVLDVSELDGFLTAVVTGPATLPPSQWIPAIWGDFEPTWPSDDEAGELLVLMIRHMNAIALQLDESPDDFEPMFLESIVEDETVLVVDEWCEGYVRGMALSAEEWDAAPPEIVDRLMPILGFTESMNWAAHDEDHNEADRLRDAIAPNVRAIHAYWLEQRIGAAAAPFRRDEPRVGRNDPCPCGSGKKYKHCCLQ